MEAFLLSILMMLDKVQDIKYVPADVPSEWVSQNTWKETPSGQLVFEAESNTLLQQCKNNPDGFIEFPVVLYGAHEIFLDNDPRIKFGNPDMQHPNYVVSAPVIECQSVSSDTKLQWRATAYSRYFARVGSYPKFIAHKPLTKLFGETLYIGCSIGMFILMIFAWSVLYNTRSKNLIFALCLSMLGVGMYEFLLVAPAFQIDLPVLTLHRIGDFSLSSGIFCVIACFFVEGLIPRKLFIAQAVATAASLPFIVMATRGDTIQFGTSIPMPTVILSFGFAAIGLCRKLWRDRSLETGLTFAFGLLFFLVVTNDISVFTGSSYGYTFMSAGQLLAFLILLLAVNQRISATYVERDYLRENLEVEVVRKTTELRNKTELLETTMKDLRQTQAELVHSAKLASLGTLSAGIAHEINNSINFVNGAVAPLEKIIGKLESVSPRDHELGRKLLAAIKDGIGITVEIVKSLRQFTGLNQAKLKDIQILEVVRSVKTILHSKLKENYTVFVEIPESLMLYGDVVGINQILMNLFTNAMDAMPEGGSIVVTGTETESETVLEISDSGAGIPEEIKTRIFDPFFTTKEVGSGTGLGLYIINKEMDRHHGRITVDSIVGKGTKFRLVFPKKADVKAGAAA